MFFTLEDAIAAAKPYGLDRDQRVIINALRMYNERVFVYNKLPGYDGAKAVQQAVSDVHDYLRNKVQL